MELRGKVAVVTGAGGNGSGRAIARRFARAGAAVVINDIDDSGARETVRQIEAAGGRCAFHPADVRNQRQVRALIAFAEETFGGLAVLVNNASAPFHPDEPLEHWFETVETDFLGTMYGIRAGIDALRRSVAALSSISARSQRCGMAARGRRLLMTPPKPASCG